MAGFSFNKNDLAKTAADAARRVGGLPPGDAPDVAYTRNPLEHGRLQAARAVVRDAPAPAMPLIQEPVQAQPLARTERLDRTIGGADGRQEHGGPGDRQQPGADLPPTLEDLGPVRPRNQVAAAVQEAVRAGRLNPQHLAFANARGDVRGFQETLEQDLAAMRANRMARGQALGVRENAIVPVNGAGQEIARHNRRDDANLPAVQGRDVATGFRPVWTRVTDLPGYGIQANRAASRAGFAAGERNIRLEDFQVVSEVLNGTEATRAVATWVMGNAERVDRFDVDFSAMFPQFEAGFALFKSENLTFMLTRDVSGVAVYAANGGLGRKPEIGRDVAQDAIAAPRRALPGMGPGV